MKDVETVLVTVSNTDMEKSMSTRKNIKTVINE